MYTVTWTTLRGSPMKKTYGRSPPMSATDAESLVQRILREDPIATVVKFPPGRVAPEHLSLKDTTWEEFNGR